MTQGGAAAPQNDRELLLQLNQEIKGLALSITEFSKTLKYLEEKRIAGLEERLDSIDKWRDQISGGWKLAVGIWVVLTGGAIAIVKSFMK